MRPASDISDMTLYSRRASGLLDMCCFSFVFGCGCDWVPWIWLWLTCDTPLIWAIWLALTLDVPRDYLGCLSDALDLCLEFAFGLCLWLIPLDMAVVDVRHVSEMSDMALVDSRRAYDLLGYSSGWLEVWLWFTWIWLWWTWGPPDQVIERHCIFRGTAYSEALHIQRHCIFRGTECHECLKWETRRTSTTDISKGTRHWVTGVSPFWYSHWLTPLSDMMRIKMKALQSFSAWRLITSTYRCTYIHMYIYVLNDWSAFILILIKSFRGTSSASKWLDESFLADSVALSVHIYNRWFIWF